MADQQRQGNIGIDDMNIPELRLIQATGGDYAKESGAEIGQFYISTTSEIFDAVDVQILNVRKNRTFWGRSDITDEPPICSSTDGVTSIDGQVCQACQHYRERPALDKEERRKECQTGYVVLALDENGMPLIIRLNGISADAGRDLNAMLYFNKGLRSNRGNFFFHISSWKKKTAAGEAYAFKFTLSKDKQPTTQQLIEYMSVAKEIGMEKAGAPSTPKAVEPAAAIPRIETKEVESPPTPVMEAPVEEDESGLNLNF